LFVLYFLLLCFSSCKKIGHDKYLKLVLKSLTVSFYIFIIATFIYTFLAFLNGVVSPKSGSYVVTGPTGRALTSLTACLFSIIWINFYFINKNRKYLLYFFCSLLIVLGTLVRIALGGEIIALVVLFLSRGKLILIVISGGIGSLFIIYFGERFISEMFVVASIDELDFSNISELIQNIRLTGRLEVWRISLTNFFQNPILGGGTGSSNQLLHDSGIGLEQSHNDYIKVLSDLGGIGFVLYLLWYFVPLTILCNTIRRNSENGYAIMAVSCLLALMVFSLTDNVISYSPYLFPLAFILFPLALIPDRKFHIYNKNDNQERL
jgi:O-antigen ligase